MPRPAFVLFALLPTACDPAPDDPAPPSANPLEAQQAFFENMGEFCGQTFGGRTIYAEEGDTTFEPARLYFVVEGCRSSATRLSAVGV